MFSFQELELTGFLLCYGPLLLIVGGFIAFAAITDADARRKYLRRDVAKPADQATRAATPSGLSVSFMPAAAPAPVATPAPAPKPEPVVEAAAPAPAPEPVAPVAAAEPDDLKKIEGIGPKMASILMEAGVTTFAALAAKTPEELRAILDAAGASAINDPTTWPEQAKLAATGDWAALETLQDNLKGGRAA